ncbi:MAG: radical SAM protein, partial [Lentisphaerae bacterium]|nr:radical SAM protein [Lentisphaerota bacterium]
KSFTLAYCRIGALDIHKDGRGSSVIIEITRQCNKSCPHCYSQANGGPAMDTAALERIVAFARAHYKHVFLTGGEPTLDDRIFTISQKHEDVLFFFFTNGSLIDDDFAARLATRGNLVPIVSINGQSEATHDSLGGEGSFAEVHRAIAALNRVNAPWGFLSVVTNRNAKEVLSREFVKDKRDRRAILGRYLEFHPFGHPALQELIPTGETYYMMEQRKREIVKNGEIYMQDLTESRCGGLLFFDVNGHIKLCPFFHFAKHRVADNGDIGTMVDNSENDWRLFPCDGECPVYADASRFRRHLERLGWRRTLPQDEGCPSDPDTEGLMSSRYRDFLAIKAEKGL